VAIGAHRPDEAFTVGDWTVQPDLCRLSRGHSSVHLQPRPMELLVFLAQHAGSAVSRELIHDAVWQQHAVGEGVLRRTIAILRRALGDDAHKPTYIETIPKRGYCLIAPIGRTRAPEHPGGTDTIDHGLPCGESLSRHDDGRAEETPAQIECSLEFGDHGFPLREVVNIIGRTPEATVRLGCDRVSRRHAQIIIAGGSAFIEDLASKNGTSVRGRRIHKPTQLADGDEIAIGSFVMVFRDHTACATDTELYTEDEEPDGENRDLH
jgi:DNA-binding winged helix-turn-helix (wHTH) protein